MKIEDNSYNFPQEKYQLRVYIDGFFKKKQKDITEWRYLMYIYILTQNLSDID